MPRRPTGAGEPVRPRRSPDQGFVLPLPTEVRWTDPAGQDLAEETILSYMSARMAAFTLTRPVPLETRLKLLIRLPPRLSEDANLRLVINGRVALAGPAAGGAGWRVSLRLESRYIIQAEKPEAEAARRLSRSG